MSLLELIVGNLALASLIGGLALVVGRGGRRAALAHALWVMFFVKLITPPLVSVPLPVPTLDLAAWRAASRTAVVSETAGADKQTALVDNATITSEPFAASPATVAIANPVAGIYAAPSNRHDGSTFFNATNLMAALGLVWLIGFVVVVVRGLVRLTRFRNLLAECGCDDEEATEQVRLLLGNQRRIRWWTRTPRVVRASVRVSPMLFGFATRPLIVCPEQLWQELSPQDRKSFLAHEAAHFYRKDHWVRWLELTVSSIYWWFPAVYYAKKQLERHEEACCDAQTVKMLETKPRQYAETLLRVVDFISEYEVGLPKLASGMQPTDSLEERLRLLMRNELESTASRLHSWGAGLTCAAIWMVHPDAYQFSLTANTDSTHSIASIASSLPTLAPIEPTPAAEQVIEAPLPEAPSGFWNASPVRHWAGFSFRVSGYRLTAISGRGFVVERSGSDPLNFSERGLRAIAEIPSTGRVIIGDAEGNVRLWDLKAGMPVSLLGRHSSAVTSLAVAPDGSVFSADSAGSVIRWELQSGQTIARWTSDEVTRSTAPSNLAVQSIRCSNDGRWIAVVCGDWKETVTPKRLYILESQTLTRQSEMVLDANTAITLQTDQGQWCSVRWNGEIELIETGEVLGVIKKHDVSALLLSQHADRSVDSVFRQRKSLSQNTETRPAQWIVDPF